MNTEFRFAEFRASSESLNGTLMNFGSVATYGDFRESFVSGSFHYLDDLILNVQHDRARPVAKMGRGLTLAEEPVAIRVAVIWPKTYLARQARELVDAELLSGFSVEFRAEKETWDGNHRIIEKASLLGLALVDKPAYTDAVVVRQFEERAKQIEIPHMADSAVKKRLVV